VHTIKDVAKKENYFLYSSILYNNPIKIFVVGIRLLNIQIIFLDNYFYMIFYPYSMHVDL